MRVAQSTLLRDDGRFDLQYWPKSQAFFREPNNVRGTEDARGALEILPSIRKNPKFD